ICVFHLRPGLLMMTTLKAHLPHRLAT
ncbi:hypothetical protein AZZ81_000355, partial [Klebsiella aerogenes]